MAAMEFEKPAMAVPEAQGSASAPGSADDSLWRALSDVDLAGLKSALRDGAKVDSLRGEDGDLRRRPLNMACSLGWAQGARVLLAHGASPDSHDDMHPAIIAALWRGRWDENGVDCLASLIGEGAILNCETHDGSWTPLSMAAYNGHLRMCELLVAGGADVRHAPSKGESALAWALSAGDQAPISAPVREFLMGEAERRELRQSTGGARAKASSPRI